MVDERDIEEVLGLLVQVMNNSRYNSIDSTKIVGLAMQLATLRQIAQANVSLKEIASCVTARSGGKEHVILTG